MRKFSCLKLIFCFFLCFLLTFNASFRRDTYAFVPVVVAEGVLVSLILSAMGIYTTEFLSTDEGQELCRDIAVYLEQEYSEWDNVVARAASPALGYCSIPVDYFTDTCKYILDYFQTKQPQLFPGYVPSTVVNGSVTGSNIPDFFCNFIADFVYNNNPYHFNYNSSESDFLSRYSSTIKSKFSEMIDYKYINVYYHTSSASSSSIVSSTYCNHLFVAHNGDLSDGYYALVSSVCFYDYSSGASINYPSWYFSTPNNAVPFYSGTYGNGYTGVVSKDRYETKSLTAADYTQTAVYTNTDLVEDYVDSPPATVPDDIVSLDPADNAITNPDYITNVVNNYTTVVEGENVIPLHYPSYADTQNVIVDGLQDLTRTDVLDGSAKVGIQPVNEVVSTVQGAVTVTGIADAAVDGIVQAITSVFTLSPGFFDGWLNKFQLAFDSKGYDFDFNFLKNGGDNRIPDFYINFRGYDILLIKSDWIYACSDFVRPFIRAYIYFLIIMHDRKRILHLIRGTYMPEEVMYDVDIIGAQLDDHSDKWLY